MCTAWHVKFSAKTGAISVIYFFFLSNIQIIRYRISRILRSQIAQFITIFTKKKYSKLSLTIWAQDFLFLMALFQLEISLAKLYYTVVSPGLLRPGLLQFPGLLHFFGILFIFPDCYTFLEFYLFSRTVTLFQKTKFFTVDFLKIFDKFITVYVRFVIPENIKIRPKNNVTLLILSRSRGHVISCAVFQE